jgi:hypothetical protein
MTRCIAFYNDYSISCYSSATAYIVMVIVALAEELLAALEISLLGVPVSAGEVLASDITDVGNLASIIISSNRAIGRISLFIRTVRLKPHKLPVG